MSIATATVDPWETTADALPQYRFDIGAANKIGKRRVALEVNGLARHVHKFDIDDHTERSRYFDRVVKETGLPEKTLGKLFVEAIQPDGPEKDAVKLPTLPPRRCASDSITTPIPLAKPVVHGLFRVGETVQLTNAPKTNKSWTVLGLALSVATGRKWIGTFDVEQSRVLIIDTELEQGTLDHRLKRVAEAMDIDAKELVDTAGCSRVDTISLRGRPMTFDELGAVLPREIEPGYYGLVIIDSIYRCYPERFSENDNADQTRLHTSLVTMAKRLGAANLTIHHATKGSQSNKGVTDIGAGGGAQSRAADTFLVMREHELADCCHFAGVLRSFPPLKPMTLKWEFPIWEFKPGVEPAVKQSKSPYASNLEKQFVKDIEFLKDWVSEVGEFNAVMAKDAIGGGQEKANSRVRQLLELGLIEATEMKKRTKNSPNETQHYQATDKLSGEAVQKLSDIQNLDS